MIDFYELKETLNGKNYESNHQAEIYFIYRNILVKKRKDEYSNTLTIDEIPASTHYQFKKEDWLNEW